MLERRVHRRAFFSDVRCECFVEPLERSECRVFSRAAVECASQRVGDPFRARAVDRDVALCDEGRVHEDFERYAEVCVARVDRPADRTFARRIVAVCIVHAHALGIAFEVALDFKFASVGERVAQRGRKARARPRPPVVFPPSFESVQGREKGGRHSRFSGFVGTVHDVDAWIEGRRPVAQPPESLDPQFDEFHGAMSAPSNAASAYLSAAAPSSPASKRSRTTCPRTVGSRAMLG